MPVPLITHPAYSFPFPARHRFPMEKFGLLHRYLRERGLARRENTFRPGTTRDELLTLVHCPDYIRRFRENRLADREMRRIGLPWSEPLARRTLIAPSGTLLAARYALSRGVACHLAGGTHHAHRDFGSGFCVVNDLAITARALLESGRVQRILILDCDVHQGDGTARLLADEPRAFTCSIHCARNFPLRRARSDLDVEVPAGIRDEAYLEQLAMTLDTALARLQPDLVLYDAGVDVHEDDPLGHAKLTSEGIARRDFLVLERCREQNIPVATVIGGGYDDDRRALARRHAIVIEQAFRVFTGESRTCSSVR